MYIDSIGKYYSEEEIAAFSSSEIENMGIHVYVENKEKQLFEKMDEMIT